MPNVEGISAVHAGEEVNDSDGQLTPPYRNRDAR